MTRTIWTLRATGRMVLVEIGAAVGTFVGLAWIAMNAVMAIDHGLGGPVGERSVAAVPELAVWAGTFAVAVGGTIWLERGGYRRLGADSTGGIDFAWLSLVALPATFLPGSYALSLLVDPPAGAVYLYLLGCALIGVRFAFYGELERLGHGRTGLAIVVTAVAVTAVAPLVPVWVVINSLGEPPVTATSLRVAIACFGQALVLRLGIGDALSAIPNPSNRRS